jgi:peptidoglycan/LPS O-acetylase OafA/YrhL
MKFRYDINAGRAIAVTGVLLFHYHVPFFSGGFSGVDVFFVISGYLMSKIILNSLRDEKFSVWNFYGKRAKRIVPALLFLVLGLTIIDFFVYFPVDYQQSSKNAASSVLFLSNFFYWQHSNYFDPASDTNILLHTWSLSVEWQFYLLYPIILAVLYKFVKAKNRLFSIFVVSTVILFGLSLFITKISPTASFYLLPSRAWELLLGGVAFYAEGYVKDVRLKKALAIIGYLSIFVCFVFLNSLMKWPGIYTAVPVLATFFILISNYNDFKILKVEAVQMLGKISYSLYLWHWPVYVIAQYVGFDIGKPVAIVLLITISILLAYLSYRFIEKPDLSNKSIVAGMVVFTLVTLFFGNINTNSILFKSKSIEISGYAKNHAKDIRAQFSTGCCFVTSEVSGITSFNKKQCLNIVPNQKNILLIGDSHAAQFSESMRELLAKRNINLNQATASGCFPLIQAKGKSRCAELINYIYNDFIVHNAPAIDGVIISANWIDSKDSPEVLSNNLQKTIEYLEKYHLSVIVVGQNETYKVPFPSIAARDYQYNSDNRINYLNSNSTDINDFLKKRFPQYYIDVYNKFPLSKLSATDVPYMIDQNHFSKYGTDVMADSILSDKKAEKFLSKIGTGNNSAALILK